MKKLLSVFLVACILTACSSYGEKYKVNEKSEIYYKDGMTSGDAKILGDFLVKNGYFDNQTEKTVQLGRENDTINIKFVVDKTKLTEDVSADALFMIVGTAISTEVFGGKPLKIVLADQSLKGFRDMTVPGIEVPDSTK
jgi:hypothetical protein